MWIYQNGKFLRGSDASIGVEDGGLLHGAGLFETIRAETGRLFRLESHLERLRRSAAVLLRPISRDELPGEQDFRELLSRNDLKSARVRLTVTAGPLRVEAKDGTSNLTTLITAGDLAPYPPEHYEKGVTVVISRFRQSAADPLAGHKTTSYLPRLLALREARESGGFEALWFTPENLLAEGSISNVFVVRENVVKTPPLSAPVLPGIARAAVIQIAAGAGLEVVEEAINIDDLLDADEVFLTNTIMQIVPVVDVEKRPIGDGKVGPVAARLFDAYRDLVKKECDPR